MTKNSGSVDGRTTGALVLIPQDNKEPEGDIFTCGPLVRAGGTADEASGSGLDRTQPAGTWWGGLITHLASRWESNVPSWAAPGLRKLGDVVYDRDGWTVVRVQQTAAGEFSLDSGGHRRF